MRTKGGATRPIQVPAVTGDSSGRPELEKAISRTPACPPGACTRRRSARWAVISSVETSGCDDRRRVAALMPTRPLPSRNSWFHLARSVHYDAGRLAERLALSPLQLEEVWPCLFLYRPQDWLDYARLCDAAALAARGRSPPAIERAVFVYQPRRAVFWNRFDRVWGGPPERFRSFFLACRKREQVRIEQWFGSFRAECMSPAPWAGARHNLLGRSVFLVGNGRSFPPMRKSLIVLLHLEVCGGTASTREVLADLIYQPLVRRLGTGSPHIDEHWVREAVGRAIIDYLRAPDRFDPAQGRSLEGFLQQAASWSLSHLARGERRHIGRADRLARTDQPGFETACPGSWVVTEELAQEQAETEREVLVAWRRQWLEEFSQGLGERDRQVLQLMREGVRDFRAYAAVLGLTDQPKPRQREAVHRVKILVYKGLKRFLRGRRKAWQCRGRSFRRHRSQEEPRPHGRFFGTLRTGRVI
jgi:DNA-directed RNA polymerase specialized sigma24 family protein